MTLTEAINKKRRTQMTDKFETNEKLFKSLPKKMAGSNVIIIDDIKKRIRNYFRHILMGKWTLRFREGF